MDKYKGLSEAEKEYLNRFNKLNGTGETHLYTTNHSKASISGYEDMLTESNKVQYKRYRTKADKRADDTRRLRAKKKTLLTIQYLKGKYGADYTKARGMLKKIIELDSRQYMDSIPARKIDKVRIADIV